MSLLDELEHSGPMQLEEVQSVLEHCLPLIDPAADTRQFKGHKSKSFPVELLNAPGQDQTIVFFDRAKIPNRKDPLNATFKLTLTQKMRSDIIAIIEANAGAIPIKDFFEHGFYTGQMTTQQKIVSLGTNAKNIRYVAIIHHANHTLRFFTIPRGHTLQTWIEAHIPAPTILLRPIGRNVAEAAV